jgi:hypothetical protein
MPYLHLLPDPGMNYTLNRPLLDGTSPARIKEIGAVAPQINVDWIYRTMQELVCAHSVTARIFTAREGAEQHGQVGNSALARKEIVRWLARFYPDVPAIKS